MNFDKDRLHKEHLNYLRKLKIRFLERYDIASLMYTDIMFSYDMRYIYVLKQLIVRLFTKYLNVSYIENLDSDILLFTFIYNRKDHDSYWKHFKEIVEEYKEVSFNYTYNIRNIDFRFINNLITYIKVFISLKKIKPLKSRLWLALQLYNTINITNYLDKKGIDCNSLFTFFDGGFEGNLITQYFKQKGSATITLQHGQCLFRGEDIDRLNQSIILNFISDFCICKGEFAKKQFLKAGFADNKLLPLGNLECISNNNETVICKLTSKIFCVFLDTPSYPFYEFSTQEIIKIANEFSKKYSYNYFIKPHPADIQKKYLEYYDQTVCSGILDKNYSINQIKKMVDFSIFHASAIYADLLLRYMKSYRLRTYINFNIVLNEDDIFENIDQLFLNLNKWNELSVERKRKYIESQNELYSNPENVKIRYIEFIKSIRSHKITNNYSNEFNL